MTSLGELLDELTISLWRSARSPTPDLAGARDTLPSSVRLLGVASGGRIGSGRGARSRRQLIEAASAALAAVHNEQPATSGPRSHIGELAAVAADAATLRAARMHPDERLELARAASAPIRAGLDLLRAHTHSHNVINAATLLRRIDTDFAQLRLAPAAAAFVDRQLPGLNRHGIDHRTGLSAAAAALDPLAHAHRSKSATPADAYLLTLIGIDAAARTRSIHRLLADTGHASASTDFDDTLRLLLCTRDSLRAIIAQPGVSSRSELLDTITAAANQLRACFGPLTAPTLHQHNPAELATTWRALANRIPGLTLTIASAAVGWAEIQHDPVFANETISYRDRNGINRWAMIAPLQLDPAPCLDAALAARQAGIAATAAAAQADQSTPFLGAQPDPHLAAAHAHVARRSPGPATTRWAAIAGTTHPEVCAGPDWPALADVLDRAAAAGVDVAATLPSLTSSRPLPATNPARELRARLISAHPAAALTPAPGRDIVHGLRGADDSFAICESTTTLFRVRARGPVLDPEIGM